MFITAVEITGLAELPELHLSGLGRVVQVGGPSPASVALGDAIALAFAALSPAHCAAMLERWGVLGPGEQPEILADPFPSQASWTDRLAARHLVDDPNHRSITVSLTIELDPLLFRELRAEAARDPRLVTALAEGPMMTLCVGGLLATSYDALALSLQSVRIGEERFPTLPRERPLWLTRLLLTLGERFHRHTPGSVAARALQVATSRQHHARYVAWQDALRERLGSVRVASGPGDAPVILADEKPLRRWGVAGRDLAALAGAVHLTGADVLWATTEDPLMAGAVEAGALEQVWWVCAAGEPLKPTRKIRRAARFPRANA